MKIKVGRHIEGISLNPLEYILDGPDGEIKWFENKEAAVVFLKAQGLSDDDIYWYRFVGEDKRDIDDPELIFE
ncbi:MAG: hypothetical protein LBK83_03700 [Treponema sp.]|jgi:hypothetical protein|nr:hypothetical protein [Treponema sp.]